jgi:Ca-activated chloride channel family protein
VSIGIIFDLSGSMINGKALANARSAALRFIELGHNANDYFVIAFTTRPLVLIDWTRGSQAAALAFNRYYFSSKNTKDIPLNTALYDSVYLGIEKIRSGAHQKQVILLISDGQDNDSRYTFKELRERLKETGVLLYSIGIVPGNDRGSSLGMEGQSLLDELSTISGGKAFFPENKKEIDESFDYIASELRRQYVLGFKPSKETVDGKWHRIQIKVTPPLTVKGKKQHFFVRSRDGYLSLKNLPLKP